MSDIESSLSKLPKTWFWSSVGEIACVKGGKRLPKGHKYSTDPTEHPYIRVTDFDNMSVNREDLRYLKPKTHEQIKRYTINKDDVYISIAGSIGKVGIIPEDLDGANLTENAAKITDLDIYYNKALSYALNSLFSQEQIAKLTTHTNQPKLALFRIEKIKIPVPPLPEQKSIVNKIEELFSRLDFGIEALKQVQTLLKRYRQSVLKSAVEGKLTSKWHEQHKDELEPADKLLERILKERKEKWEAEQLTNFKAKGKKPPNNWQNKYKEPTPPDISKLPKMPEGWVWVNLEQLGFVIGGLTKNQKRKDYSLSLPYLRVANVYADELKLDDVQVIGVTKEEVDRVLLKKNDLLVVEGNGSKDQIGRVALWDESISPCVHQNHIIKVRLIHPDYAKFILYWLLSLEGRNQITHVASSTSGLYTLSLSKVSSLPIPLAPLKEQTTIIDEIESCLSHIQNTSLNVIQSQNLSIGLRQSILKKAFEGKLVPQDPNDEPASVLLERIKAEKSNPKKSKQMETF